MPRPSTRAVTAASAASSAGTDAAAGGGTAPPVPPPSAPPLPIPNPVRVGATWADSTTPRSELPCYTTAAAGAEAGLDLTRVFFDGKSCATGSRMALGLRLAPLGCALEPIIGRDNYAAAMDQAETISRSRRGDKSQAYRDKEAKILIAEHVVSLA